MSPATATHDLGRRVLRHLRVRPGQTLLDVSAGSEALTIAAARAGADVTAIDISPTMLVENRGLYEIHVIAKAAEKTACHPGSASA